MSLTRRTLLSGVGGLAVGAVAGVAEAKPTVKPFGKPSRTTTKTFTDGVGLRDHSIIVGGSPSGGWTADLSGITTGSMGVDSWGSSATQNGLKAQWNYWDNSGGSVVSLASEGIAARPDGIDRAVKWYKPAGNDQVYQKLNRTFDNTNWPLGIPSQVGDGGSSGANSPADVSGIYTVYQYIPLSLFTLNPGHGWVITSEFKENFRISGVWDQFSTYGLYWDNFNGSGVVKGDVAPFAGQPLSLFLSDYVNRWVKFQWRLYQGSKDLSGNGGRCELWIDNTLKTTRYESTRHIGSAAFSTLAETEGFLWVSGQYTSNQTTGGIPDYMGTDVTSYVGLSTLVPITTPG